MNWFRGHKKCYFTILLTAVWNRFRQVKSFDSIEIEVAHKLTKKVADVMFVGLRKLHYNVMSRVMDMNEADILAGRAKSIDARHIFLYEATAANCQRLRFLSDIANSHLPASLIPLKLNTFFPSSEDSKRNVPLSNT